ncbi:MAG: precorrin-8X methylmutase, partial [Alphaproteobacteria bacterium]|nr:precorrin-8X methylmutase [Alphaproteobacteria bacterium]
PAAIYRLSFRMAREETDLSGLPLRAAGLAVRLVHACGRPEIVQDLALSPGIIERAEAGLAAGAPIVADTRMTAEGVIGREAVCAIDAPSVAAAACAGGGTRAMAAMDALAGCFDGAVVAVGNAPTALFRLLELVEKGAPVPLVVLGFPVGFVGAAESKAALIESGLPHIALRGRFGGSALAAAAVNALLNPAESAP